MANVKMKKIKENVGIDQLQQFGYSESTFSNEPCYAKHELRFDVYINKSSRKIVVDYIKLGAHPSDDQHILLAEDIDNFIDDIVVAGLVESEA